MKKQYEEPKTEIIRYQAEDIILTSSHHHCGTGVVTGHEYVDTTGDDECDTDNDFQCGGESGDYGCEVFSCGENEGEGVENCDEYSCNEVGEGT